MTLRLSRHQRLELCRLRSGRLLLLCWTLAPARYADGRVTATWIIREVGEWPPERVLTTKQQQVKGGDHGQPQKAPGGTGSA